ncbi:MAG: choice-of-anchor D domain-containing protein [Deltaproteobacteria bacterium]|nr:choice-of-anchor D domain-containing protein [Deltaproteobacteria bacterium]
MKGNRPISLLFLPSAAVFFGAWAAAGGCSDAVNPVGGGSDGAAGPRDGGPQVKTCSSSLECGSGEECKGGTCVAVASDGGPDLDGGGDADIPNGDAESCQAGACGPGNRCNAETGKCEAAAIVKADPDNLDFGAVPYNTEVKRSLSVSNVGSVDLTVTSVQFEQGTNPDPANPIFSYAAGKPLPVTLKPTEFVGIEVTYRQDDAKPDTGALLVTSSDLDAPLLRVPMKSVYKGVPDLAIVDSSKNPPEVLYPLPGDADEYTVDIGNVDIGASKETVVTFLNTTGGDAVFSIAEVKAHKKTDNEFAISFKDPADPSKTLAVPVYMGAGATVDMHVVYAPTIKVEDEQTDLDLITNDDDVNNDGAAGGNILYVKLRAKGGWAPPGISVDKTSVDFGEVQVNSTGTVPVKVCNTGTTQLNIAASSGLETPGTDYSTSPATLEMALGANGCVDVTVTFAPLTLGKKDNVLVIDSDDPVNPELRVALTGVGTNPTISVDPQRIDFGDVAFGVPAAPVKVTVKNTGVGSLSVSTIDLTQGSAADYSLAGKPALPATLLENQGNSIEFNVAFTPALVGSGISGAVQIDNGDNKNPHLTIPLTGNGVNRKPDGEVCNVDGECAGGHCCTGKCSSWKDPENCGACGTPCTLPDATPTCATGTCKVASCDSGHANCDINDANGCELAHVDYPSGNTCNNPSDAGSACGDNRWWSVFKGCHTAVWDSTPFKVETGNTSKWFQATATNCMQIACTDPVRHRVQLTVPVGVEYDLCVYKAGCASAECTTATASAPVTVEVNSEPKEELDFTYVAEVRFKTGTSCENWSLSFTGILQQ